MTQEHPITPPSQLVTEWWNECTATSDNLIGQFATKAARWGADQELEACCEWLVVDHWKAVSENLRDARRPKPPSLKAQALDELNFSFSRGYLKKEAVEAIRRALESLPD